MARQPRGIRNNNPGNIEHIASNKWKGAIGDDGRFVRFEEPFYGIRALAKILVNYQKRYGLKTIASIVARWAPPVENDTNSYVVSVGKRTGFDTDQPLDLSDSSVLVKLVDAIIYHENGQQPYSRDLLYKGVEDALK